MRDPVAEIITYNRRFLGRYAEPLKRKVERLCSGPFGFFRGTFHLFARDVLDGVPAPWRDANPFTAVQIRLVGDIHSENYGTFKAADGTVRYDVNDFDETTTGSFDFDVKRAATSLFLAAAENGVAGPQAVGMAESFVRTYVQTIARFAKKGGAEDFGYTDKHPPDLGPVKRLLREAADASRTEFISALTVLRAGRRELLRTPKHFDLRPEHRAQAERLVADYVARLPDPARRGKDFFRIEDVCGQIAGCGSLGRLRYAVLLVGEGGAEARNSLLEFKEALPSAYDELRGRGTAPEQLRNRAEEVTGVQRAMQTASGRHLGFAVDGDMSFQVRGAGPRDRRLDWKDVKPHDFPALGSLYAELLAKCHAKADSADGRPGQARLDIAAALAGHEETFIKRVTAFALAYSELVEDDHRRLVARRGEVERALLP